jgi:hypothetical protein
MKFHQAPVLRLLFAFLVVVCASTAQAQLRRQSALPVHQFDSCGTVVAGGVASSICASTSTNCGCGVPGMPPNCQYWGLVQGFDQERGISAYIEDPDIPNHFAKFRTTSKNLVEYGNENSDPIRFSHSLYSGSEIHSEISQVLIDPDFDSRVDAESSGEVKVEYENIGEDGICTIDMQFFGVPLFNFDLTNAWNAFGQIDVVWVTPAGFIGAASVSGDGTSVWTGGSQYGPFPPINSWQIQFPCPRGTLITVYPSSRASIERDKFSFGSAPDDIGGGVLADIRID